MNIDNLIPLAKSHPFITAILIAIAILAAVLTGMKVVNQKSSGDNSHNINISGKNANVNINIPDKNDETKAK